MSGGSESRPPHPTTAKFDLQNFKHGNESTHQADSIHAWVFPYIFGNLIIFHSIANDLGRRYLGGNSEEGNDVGML